MGGDGRGERASVFPLLSANCTYCSLTAKLLFHIGNLFDFYSKEKKAKSDLIRRAWLLVRVHYLLYMKSFFIFELFALGEIIERSEKSAGPSSSIKAT